LIRKNNQRTTVGPAKRPDNAWAWNEADRIEMLAQQIQQSEAD